MRLQSGSSKCSVDELREFSKWILSVGDGNAGGPNDGEAVIEVAKDILIDPGPIQFQQLLKARFQTYRSIFGNLNISKKELFWPQQMK